MLIGYHKTVDDLKEILESKLNDNKMTLNVLERGARDLQTDMRKNQPKRGTEDSRPRDLLEMQNEGTRLNEQNTWLSSKLEEAQKAIEKDPKNKEIKIHLSLNDCLMLGIEPEADTE